jgi:hypothetical protein
LIPGFCVFRKCFAHDPLESLRLAVAGAAGASSSTAYTVSELLLPDELGPSTLKRLVKVSLLGEDVFEGVPCYRIKATEVQNAVELWVGKNDLLLRKLRRETKFDDRLWIREEIRRKIQVDQSIPEVVFNYKPPIPLTPRKDIDIEDIDKLLDPGPPAWSEFRSDEGRFSLLMPEKPRSQATTIQTPQGRFEQHAFIASHYPLVCMIAYTDIPRHLLVANNVDEFFESVRDQFIKEVGGKLASESSLSLDGHSGREIEVHMFRGRLRLRLFLVGDRLYVLSFANSDKALESDMETPNKFFGSFKLHSITKPIAYQALETLVRKTT